MAQTATRSAVPASARTSRAVDVAFGVLVVGALARLWTAAERSWFFADEWALAMRGRSLDDFLDPYNGHLSIVYVAIYRVAYELWGFSTYVPVRVIGLGALVSVPVALYLTTRARLTPPISAVASASVLLFPGMSMEPAAMNHHLTLLAAVVVAWALRGEAGERADWWVAGGLTFALATSGGGVAVAVAAVVHAVCSRATPRRWLAVSVPTGAWALWWLTAERASTSAGASPEAIVETSLRGLHRSLSSLALDSGWGGWLLAAGVVVMVAHRVRGGLQHAASTLAWTSAAGFWWMALVYSRGLLADPDTFRYRYVGAVLLLLAAVPPRPLDLRRLARAAPLSARISASGVVVAAVVLAAVGWFEDVGTSGRRLDSYGRGARGHVAVAMVHPQLVPDEHRYELLLGWQTARDVRRAAKRYGVPFPASADRADTAVVRAGAIQLTDVRHADVPERCRFDRRVHVVPPDQRVRIFTAEATRIQVRRFGERWVVLQTLGPAAGKWTVLRGYGAVEPWELRAAGACMLLEG